MSTTPLITTLLIVGILIAANAFYVGTEFAVVSVRRGRIRRLAHEGSRTARLLVPVIADNRSLYRALTACQVGITASSLGLGAFVQVKVALLLLPVFAGIAGAPPVAAESASLAVTLLAVTLLQVILGEMVPKSIALRNPMRWALAAALPLRWSQIAFSWFIVVLTGSANAILRLLRVPRVERRGLRSPAEIGLIVAESARAGVVPRELRDGIHNALRFATRTARDVMVPRVRVRGIPENVDTEELRRILREADHTRLPVYRGSLDFIIGFVHAKDVLLRTTGDDPPQGLEEMIRPVLTVPWSANAAELFEGMRSNLVHMAIVLDEHGGTEGIVTLEDLVEEVIGEVADEFDRVSPRPERLPDGRLLLRGEDSLVEINDRFGLGLASQEAHTVGGLIMEALGRVARSGDRVDVSGIRLEVEIMTRHRIETVLATPSSTPSASDP